MIDFRYGSTWYGNLVSLIAVITVAVAVFTIVKKDSGIIKKDKEKSSMVEKYPEDKGYESSYKRKK